MAHKKKKKKGVTFKEILQAVTTLATFLTALVNLIIALKK